MGYFGRLITGKVHEPELRGCVDIREARVQTESHADMPSDE
jgi:hypothetical protein